MYKYTMEELYEKAVEKLREMDVELVEIAEIVRLLQEDYIPNLTLDRCLLNVREVLKKREVVHAILTGIAIDQMANNKLLPEPIQSIIEEDEGLYGIDEILPLGIVNIYGSIGLTNFGYLDKKKIGVIDELDKKKRGNMVTTFTDDIVAAIAAAACARIAHQNIYEEPEEK